jgi:hypothetical protein
LRDDELQERRRVVCRIVSWCEGNNIEGKEEEKEEEEESLGCMLSLSHF